MNPFTLPRKEITFLPRNVIFNGLLLFSWVLPLMMLNTVTGAQEYPHKPVRAVVPFAAGGGLDTVARYVSGRLSASLGTQVIVDNRPGANGIIGTQIVASAEPDGYTLLWISPGHLANSALRPLPYDVIKSFTAVYLAVTAPNVIVVHPSVSATTVPELIALAKSKPGQITYGSSGVGGPPHVAAELFCTTTGIRMLHVPYKGSAPAFIDLTAGQISVMFLGIAPSINLINTGKVRALATTGKTRASALASIPTVQESGVPNYEILNWFGMLAPAGTPRSIVARLHTDATKAMADPDSQNFMAKQGLDGAKLTQDEFSKFLQSELVKWTGVVRTSKTRIEH